MIGLNLEWHISDTLTLQLDAHSSEATTRGTGYGHDAYVIIGNTSWNGANPTANLETKSAEFSAGGIPIIDFTLTDGQPELLPSDIGSLFGSAVKRNNKNEIDQFQLKGKWLNADNGALSRIDFGVSYTDMTLRTTNAYPDRSVLQVN